MHNANNERIKHDYFLYLKQARRQSEASIDAVAKALDRFESYNKYRDFKVFHIKQAVAFKAHLADQISQQTGRPLSKATLHSTLNALRNFFVWLAGQPGFKTRLTYSDADYFNLSAKETRIATTHRERSVPTMEQIEHVIRTMPAGSEIERRGRALIAFTILTGARDRAIASLKLKHVNLADNRVDQDAREVETKFSKSITAWFFPVGDIFRQIVADWVDYLRKEKLWGNDDPLFPATKIEQDAGRLFSAKGIGRKHWSSTGPIRKIFRAAFEQAGLPYFNPHSLRKTLVQLAFLLELTPEQLKAWSQNLGHEGVLTTFTSYGTVARHRQAEIMRDLGSPLKPTDDEDRIRRIVEEVYRKKTRTR